MRPRGTHLNEILFEIKNNESKKCIWNIVCEMEAILSRPNSGKYLHIYLSFLRG